MLGQTRCIMGDYYRVWFPHPDKCIVATAASCLMLSITFHFSLIVDYNPCIVWEKRIHARLTNTDLNMALFDHTYKIWYHIRRQYPLTTLQVAPLPLTLSSIAVKKPWGKKLCKNVGERSAWKKLLASCHFRLRYKWDTKQKRDYLYCICSLRFDWCMKINVYRVRSELYH